MPNPCVSLLLPIAVALLYIQHRGRRTQPIPVVPSSIGFRRHAPTLQCGQVCHTAPLLFLPQALLPFHHQFSIRFFVSVKCIFAKILSLPYYRIIIKVKDRKKPYQGIRLIAQTNIDLVYNMICKSTYEKFHSSIIIDIEVAMLPKQSKEVLNHLTRLHRKRS